MYSWDDFIKEQSDKEYFKSIMQLLAEARKSKCIYPNKELLFNAFKKTDIHNIKICIIGQDPYHSGVACGLAFGVDKQSKIPPSLCNIFKELKNDVGISSFEDKSLECWCKNGVFLINTALTVEAGMPLSHGNIGWDIFVKASIQKILEINKFTVFMLWGNKAQDFFREMINDCCIINGFHVLHSAHPSPFSARGFFGNKHFSRANSILKIMNIEEVIWNL